MAQTGSQTKEFIHDLAPKAHLEAQVAQTGSQTRRFIHDLAPKAHLEVHVAQTGSQTKDFKHYHLSPFGTVWGSFGACLASFGHVWVRLGPFGLVGSSFGSVWAHWWAHGPIQHLLS